jgi:hypothetical protein
VDPQCVRPEACKFAEAQKPVDIDEEAECPEDDGGGLISIQANREGGVWALRSETASKFPPVQQGWLFRAHFSNSP